MLFQQSRGCGRRAGADAETGGNDVDPELPAPQLAGDGPAPGDGPPAGHAPPAPADDPCFQAAEPAAVAQQDAGVGLGHAADAGWRDSSSCGPVLSNLDLSARPAPCLQ